jgi:hypothetical protein
MSEVSSTTASKPMRIDCDRCYRAMQPSAWILKPNGQGDLRRFTVHTCTSCRRLHDELWGFREVAG